MGFVGQNLYKLAAKVIGKQPYNLFPGTGDERDARGFQVPRFGAAVPLRDSIQAVPQSMYVYLGLDLAKQYIMIYSDNALLLPSRGVQAVQIEFDGARYEVRSGSDWSAVDGWRGVLCVKLQATGTL